VASDSHLEGRAPILGVEVVLVPVEVEVAVPAR
jgi:hypothetical protein